MSKGSVETPSAEVFDERWNELGRLLVSRCVKVAPGDRVMIAMGETVAYPLALAVNRAVVAAGGFPQIQFLSEHARHALLEIGSQEQLGWVPEIEALGMDWADCYIALRGGFDLSIHDDIVPTRLAVNQRAQGAISTLRWQKTRWCLVRVPDENIAAGAEMSYESCLDMFFDACLLDWDAEAERQLRWIEQLGRGKEIRITGRGTDLRFSVEGRTWATSSGEINMPDGEVYTAPVTGTEHGRIFFENPGVLGGRLVRGLTLEWDNGVLVSASADENEDFLREMLGTDTGSTQIGEFGIGTNEGLTTFVNDILLDEKIFGTCHIALGRAYPSCGGTNESAMHWDIVKDIREVGSVELDGQVIIDGGKILLD